MKKASVAIFVISILLAGCGHSGEQTQTHPQIVTQQDRTNWVGFYSNGGLEPRYYALTTEKVSNAGQLLFDLENDANDGNNGWGSNTSVAKIYAIIGVDPRKAVAVLMTDGSCIRADAVGSKKP